MSLRNKLIRLAYEQPQLRADLLPIVKSSGEEKVQVINQEGKTVSVNKDTLKDPKKKKLYKPVKEEKGKDENRGGEWNRTPQERAQNILKNIAKKEDKSGDDLKKELKKWERKSDKDILNWLKYVDDLETEKDPKGPKFDNEKDKQEKDEKARKFDEQKSSEKVFSKKKIDDAIDQLSKEYGDMDKLDDPGKWLSTRDIAHFKSDLNKSLQENKEEKDIDKFVKGLEDVKKEHPQPALKEMIDGMIKQFKENAERKEKKSSLRSNLIRLAYEQPQLRSDILPLITKSASVRRGETWENDNLRVHRYHDSLKVWDLKHAGKRGKNVEIMHISIRDWDKPNPKRAYLDDLTNFLTNNTTYDQYKKLVISFLETAGFSDPVGNRNSAVSFTSEKGVRISPPDMGKIVINNSVVSAYFELGGFHIQDKTDQNNLPTMMNTDRRSPKKLYKMVAGNKDLFEKMNYKEMYQFLKDYKIKFRVYMGMD